MGGRARVGFSGEVVPVQGNFLVASEDQSVPSYPGSGSSPNRNLPSVKSDPEPRNETPASSPSVPSNIQSRSASNQTDTKPTQPAESPQVNTPTTEPPKVLTEAAPIIVHDSGVKVLGANIPKEVAVQMVVTALLTTATVSLSTSIGATINRLVQEWREKLASDSVNVDKNPLDKLKAIFTDPRPKIIIRKVKRGADLIALIERFEPDGTNFLLVPIKLGDEKKITGMIDVLKTQDPNYTKNLDIRIDNKLVPYIHTEELSLWRKYLREHSKLFSGVS